MKSAYRTLVRQYHPDINPDEAAVEKFIRINDAYTVLFESFQSRERKRQVASSDTTSNTVTSNPVEQAPDLTSRVVQDLTPPSASEAKGFDGRLQSIRLTLEKLGFNTSEENGETVVTRARAFTQRVQSPPSAADKSLKQDTYEQLKELLKLQKFPRAIALIEGLAHRMPQDSEITQWQAIVYQRWGRQLIQEGRTNKARIYLTKALRTDPKNHSLYREVSRDFRQLASIPE